MVPDQFPGTVVDEGGTHAGQDDEEQGNDSDHVCLREQLAQDTSVSLEQTKTMKFGKIRVFSLCKERQVQHIKSARYVISCRFRDRCFTNTKFIELP